MLYTNHYIIAICYSPVKACNIHTWMVKYTHSYCKKKSLMVLTFRVLQCEACRTNSWWRYDMEILSRLLTLCAGHRWMPQAKDQNCGALMLSMSLFWTNCCRNTQVIRNLGRLGAHVTSLLCYDLTMVICNGTCVQKMQCKALYTCYMHWNDENRL